MPPIFPVLELEAIVQVGDKTRLNADKSYVSGGPTIAQVEIQPSPEEDSYIVADHYLDWAFAFEVDVRAGYNDKIDFSEGGAALEATVAEGTYTLAELCTVIKEALDLAGALTYTVTVSNLNMITVEATGNFAFLVTSGANSEESLFSHIGFSEDQEGASVYEGDEIETVEKLVTVTVTDSESDDLTITSTIQVISARADRLFSSDAKLRQHEPDILKFVPEGRATFKDVHRRVQGLILAWFDTQGFTDNLNEKFSKASFTDTEELEEWATHMALKLIFEGIHNSQDDVYKAKAKKYEEREIFYRNRAVLRMDLDQNGQTDVMEQTEPRTCRVIRR